MENKLHFLILNVLISAAVAFLVSYFSNRNSHQGQWVLPVSQPPGIVTHISDAPGGMNARCDGEMKKCPGGFMVPKIPPNCEYMPCPPPPPSMSPPPGDGK